MTNGELLLLKTANAYKVIYGDKKNGMLSHAYLLECFDELYLRNYLKTLAKLILCESGEPCFNCRVCRLIEKEAHSDVSIYPPNNEKLRAEHAVEIANNCVIRPLELNKRLFVISGYEKFDNSQNRLLKTLEEPPENVLLLLGTTNPSAILSTVKSRSKTVTIPAFSDEALFSYLKDDYPDTEKFKNAIILSNGFAGNIKENYNRVDLEKMRDKSLIILQNLNSSRDIADAARDLSEVEIKPFLNILKFCLGEILKSKNSAASRLSIDITNNLIKKYKTGAIIEIIEKINEVERTVHFNANRTMVIDKVLFSILEAKYKWQKL